MNVVVGLKERMWTQNSDFGGCGINIIFKKAVFEAVEDEVHESVKKTLGTIK